MKDVEFTFQPQRIYLRESLYDDRSQAGRETSELWNLFTLDVSPHGEAVRYLKSLISLREAMVISKIGSSFPMYN